MRFSRETGPHRVRPATQRKRAEVRKPARMSQEERPTFYRQELNKTMWEVPERYMNLSPVGSGAYGSVWYVPFLQSVFVEHCTTTERLSLATEACRSYKKTGLLTSCKKYQPSRPNKKCNFCTFVRLHCCFFGGVIVKTQRTRIRVTRVWCVGGD